MWFLEIYRLFCGYVHFTASGGFTERFINLCGKSSINLWALDADSERVTACTSAKSYRRIKSCATRSGMKTRITKKRGLPFFIRRYRKRIGLLYGAVFAVCFLSVMSTMIWGIEITGNNTVTDEEIVEALSDAGVKYGTLRKNVDAASTRFYVMSRLPDLSYITVNVIGSCVQAKVAEHVPEPHVIDKEAPCDVVSTVDGQIAALEVYHGTKLYKEGEAVRKGDVLAGGFIELTDGSVKFKHAEAYALIRANLDFESITSAQTETMINTKEKKRITLHLFGFDIPLFSKEDGTPVLTRNRTLILNGIRMPLGFTCETCRTYKIQTKTLNENELMLSAAENYFDKKIRTLEGAYICSQNIKAEKSDEAIKISSQVLGEISAGVARETLIE